MHLWLQISEDSWQVVLDQLEQESSRRLIGRRKFLAAALSIPRVAESIEKDLWPRFQNEEPSEFSSLRFIQAVTDGLGLIGHVTGRPRQGLADALTDFALVRERLERSFASLDCMRAEWDRSLGSGSGAVHSVHIVDEGLQCRVRGLVRIRPPACELGGELAAVPPLLAKAEHKLREFELLHREANQVFEQGLASLEREDALIRQWAGRFGLVERDGRWIIDSIALLMYLRRLPRSGPKVTYHAEGRSGELEKSARMARRIDELLSFVAGAAEPSPSGRECVLPLYQIEGWSPGRILKTLENCRALSTSGAVFRHCQRESRLIGLKLRPGRQSLRCPAGARAVAAFWEAYPFFE